MQTPENVSGSVEREGESGQINPADLTAFMPGTDAANYVPGSRVDLEQIRRALDSAENDAADLEQIAIARIQDAISPVSSDVEELRAKLAGTISNRVDDVASVADKLGSKLMGRIGDGMTAAYSQLVDMGYGVPGIEQVRYGNSTGDYLGSMVDQTGAGENYKTVSWSHYYQNLLDDPNTVRYGDLILTPDGWVRVLPPPIENPPPIDGPDDDRLGQVPGIPFDPIPPGGIVPPGSGPGPTQPPGDYEPGTLPDYQLPPGYGEWEQWCPNGVQRVVDGPTVSQLAKDAGWDGKHGPTNQYPQDTQVRPRFWDGSKRDYYSVYPDYAGNCPIGLVNNAGTGTFHNVCIVPACPGIPTEPIPPPVQPPQPPTQPPTDTGGFCPIDILPCGPKEELPSVEIPAHKEPDCGERKETDYARFDPLTKDNEEYCREFDALLAKLIPGDFDFAKVVATSFGDIGTNWVSSAIVKALTGGNQPIISSLVNRFGNWLNSLAQAAAKAAPCDATKLVPIALFHAIWKFVNQWTGVAPNALMQTLQQAENLVCQTVMPAQQSVDNAYLAGEIDEQVWCCWTQLNGNVLEAARKGIDSRRTRPTPQQISQLLRREQITKEDWSKSIRELGVMRVEDAERIFQLTQDWPTASELTPWLVRDVWDETTIDWTEVDRLFGDKYTDNAKKYFQAIGWTDELAKLHWRAHFHLPSFTMASEMYHRFRHLEDGNPLKTTLEKVKALLIQDDWHPDWIERMLAITFRPLRLVDARNAYDLRVIDDDGVKKKLLALGYSDDDTETTLAYWKKRRELRDNQKGGWPTVKTAIRMYANCEVNLSTFLHILTKVCETQEQIDAAQEAGDLARETEANRRTIQGVQWQYRRGLITDDEASSHLNREGIDPTCIPSLVELMKSRKQQTPRQLTASQLCGMLENGIITQGEFVNALMRSGWTPEDAQRIMRQCASQLTAKEMRRARAEADRLAREQKRLEREARAAKRLAECGEPPCPANRRQPSGNGTADQSNQDRQ